MSEAATLCVRGCNPMRCALVRRADAAHTLLMLRPLSMLHAPPHHHQARQADASGPSRVLVHGPPAVASRQWRLALAGVERAAAVQVEQGFAEYAAASFWARAPPSGGGGGGGADSAPSATRSSYLLMPLNELVDEHYTVYLCRHNATGAAVRKLPSFCL